MGFDAPVEILGLLMFGSLGCLLMLGVPMTFALGSLACIFLFVFGTPQMLNMLPARVFPFMTDYQLSAIPLFIFMAAILEKAGIIEELFDVVYKWLGGLKGGLASATVVVCTILAAMVGVVGATEVTMGMIALPAMLRRGYNAELACGALLAGGTLGILIPPSVMAIVYSVVAQQSLGELLAGSVFPGFLLSGLYIGYVTLRSYLNPRLGPALPPEERVDFREKLRLLRKTLAPIILIMVALGVIFLGVATPVEAAGIGTFGALIVCAMHRRLTWTTVREASLATLKATAMVMWIFFGATLFVGFFILKGGQTYVANQILGTGLRALRHHPADDGDPVRARDVHRLGRHPAADGADLPAHPEGHQVRRPVGAARRCVRRRAAVVRRHLHGQHADGLPVAAVRLFAVLSQERGAAAGHHGDHHPWRRAVPLPAGRRRHPVHHLPRHRAVAAAPVLRNVLTGGA